MLAEYESWVCAARSISTMSRARCAKFIPADRADASGHLADTLLGQEPLPDDRRAIGPWARAHPFKRGR